MTSRLPRIVTHDSTTSKWTRDDRSRLLEEIRSTESLETSQYIDYGLRIVTIDGILVEITRNPYPGVAPFGIVARTGFDSWGWNVADGDARSTSYGPLASSDLLDGIRRVLATLRTGPVTE
jgi:hypothetical protein